MLSFWWSDSNRDQQLCFSNAICSAGDTIMETIPLVEDRVIPGAKPLDFSLSEMPDVPLGPMFIEGGRYAVWDLMQAIQEDRQPITNIYEARSALEMIYGIYASHLAKNPIYFPLQDRSHPLNVFKKEI
jgi:hypothetical protein